jgi:hypothetical protein
MKWAYAIKRKIRVAVLLAVVLGLVMINNLMERRQIKILQKNFTEIYHDRLMVESYIFQLYDQLNRKLDILPSATGMVEDDGWRQKIAEHNSVISRLTNDYSETYLTPEEKQHFTLLLQDLQQIERNEQELTGILTEGVPVLQVNEIHRLTQQCFANLAALSDIQVMEGHMLKSKSSKTIMGSISTSHFEMSILILIALMIQVLVLTGKPLTFVQNPGLN